MSDVVKDVTDEVWDRESVSLCPACEREPDVFFIVNNNRYEVWCPWRSCRCDLRGAGQSAGAAITRWNELVAGLKKTLKLDPEPGSRAHRELVMGIPTTNLFSQEVISIDVSSPGFVASRLEVYGFSRFVDVEVHVVDDGGHLVSLLAGEHPVPAESFRPGNVISFNRERLAGARLVVRVTNRNLGAVIFRGALFGEARELSSGRVSEEAAPETPSSGAITKVEKL